MRTRCSCYNCGFVGDYDLPYRTKIHEYSNDDPVAEASHLELDDGTSRAFICVNCGWGMLCVLFWAGDSRIPDPVEEIRLVRT